MDTRTQLPGAETWFPEHVLSSALTYFPGVSQDERLDVRLIERKVRPASELLWFRLATPTRARRVVLKLPRASHTAPPPGAAASAADRPRLGPVASSDEKYLLEYSALASIHRHFSRVGDSRFGAIQPHELLRQHRALVMEDAPHRSLRQVLASRRRNQESLPDAFENTGAWLASFHAMPKHEYVKERQVTRDEFVDYVLRVVRYIATRASIREFAEAAAALVPRAAAQYLPPDLPLGIAHGDFALRNVLCDPPARITVIDTLARWRTSIYEDVGYFLVDLEHGGSPWHHWIANQPGDRLAIFGHAFMRGYFGDTVPRDAVRLYELLTLLDRWAAQLTRRSQSPHRTSWLGDHARRASATAYFSRVARKALAELAR